MKLRSERIGRPPIRKIGGSPASHTDSFYQSWKAPFRGTSKDGATKAGVNMAKGIGIFFAVKF